MKYMPNICARLGNYVRFCSAIGNSGEKFQAQADIFESIVSKFGNRTEIKRIFEENPYLKNGDITFWYNLNETLLRHGFETRETLSIIAKYPDALTLPEEKLNATLKLYLNHIQNLESIKTLIMSRPELLSVKPSNIKIRLPILNKYATQQYLIQLLVLCPNLLFENWNDVMDKIYFLQDEVLVKYHEVVKCQALSQPLEHIKLRFSVIEKCGLYKRPSKYEHKQTKKELVKLNNPKLRFITDNSDIEFATKVAKITLEEYNIYAEMFENEENDKSDIEESE